MKAHQQRPAGAQHPAELPQYPGQCLARDMNQRPERGHPRDRGIAQGQVGHGADLEPQARMLAPGDVDHHRRQVDAEGIQARVAQAGRDVSRAAAHVRHRPPPASRTSPANNASAARRYGSPVSPARVSSA